MYVQLMIHMKGIEGKGYFFRDVTYVQVAISFISEQVAISSDLAYLMKFGSLEEAASGGTPLMIEFLNTLL